MDTPTSFLIRALGAMHLVAALAFGAEGDALGAFVQALGGLVEIGLAFAFHREA